MTTIKTQIEQLPDNKFRELKDWIIVDETARREQEQAVRAGQQEIISELQADGVIPAPKYGTADDATDVDRAADWVDPGTRHALMYPAGAVVAHADRLWESGVDMNHWEPGSPGVYNNVWKDITPPPRVDESEDSGSDAPVAQPYEDSRQYRAGEVVHYDGSLYECQQDHYAAPGWTPLNAHAMWKQQGAA